MSENNKMNPSELERSLKGTEYPASRNDLQEQADENGATQQVMDFLESIPEQDYATPVQVTKQISEDHGDRHNADSKNS